MCGLHQLDNNIDILVENAKNEVAILVENAKNEVAIQNH